MTDESTSSSQHEGSSPTPRSRLDMAARMRAEAAQIIAAAEKIEAKEAKERKEASGRDHRIVGTAVMQLAAKSPDLARLLVEGIGTCTISGHDRKHLLREGSALAQLQAIVEAQLVAVAAPEKPVSVPTVAWFDVPYSDKDRVPPGVLYDPEVKARCAITRAIVEQMQAMGFVERQDLADRPPPARKPPAPPT